jgi:acetyl esterase/lipase
MIMKRTYYLLILVIFFISVNSQAQLINGITNEPDTSYNTPSEFIKNKKVYPQITMPEVSPGEEVKEKRNVVFRTIGNRRLLLDVFYPVKVKTNSIVVIIVFGGGWRSGNRTQHYDLAKALAMRGYTCFTPDYRLSTEAYYPAAVFDIKEAIRWVKLNAVTFNGDSSKVVMTGFSAGGQLATLVGCTGDMPAFEDYDTKNGISTKVQAIMDIDGTLSFFNDESSEKKFPDKIMASSYWIGYTYSQNPVLFKSASPLSYAEYSPPILFLNSPLERMHAGREDFIKVLNKRKVYSEIHEFENAPHAFCLFEPWFSPMVNYMDIFMQKIFR